MQLDWAGFPGAYTRSTCVVARKTCDVKAFAGSMRYACTLHHVRMYISHHASSIVASAPFTSTARTYYLDLIISQFTSLAECDFKQQGTTSAPEGVRICSVAILEGSKY